MKFQLLAVLLCLPLAAVQSRQLGSRSSSTSVDADGIIDSSNSQNEIHCMSDDETIGWMVPRHKHEVLRKWKWQWKCVQESRVQVEQECFTFLQENMFPFDRPIAGSLGFPPSQSYDEDGKSHSQNSPMSHSEIKRRDQEMQTSESLPDGLGHGIVQESIELALNAKKNYYWTSTVPKDLFFEYVLPYANVDEARNNWRPLLQNALDPILQSIVQQKETKQLSVEEVVEEINQKLWSAFTNVNNGKPIRFRSGQTPLIYDPLSIILNGFASCTGLSILFVDALRTAGIPARIAGTPAWNGEVENGNHSWVEFYSPTKQDWTFLEAMTKGLPYHACSYWFCNPNHLDGKTKVFAARYYRGGETDEKTVFRMQWDEGNLGVVGEDRTEIMTEICGKC